MTLLRQIQCQEETAEGCGYLRKFRLRAKWKIQIISSLGMEYVILKTWNT